ncbi:MAG TPA: twin-arginine translocase TatA/TatE family subunit [Candidatus Dormibacteraeota bacterium]|nr:twin-arginine translocase TatA/TatE family subunit [Candidatus Dormibacteraeota bacterium]
MLSASHLIIVFLVALLVFGPEKLPELARTLSKAMGEFHRLTGDFQETLQREMRQIEREASEPGPPTVPEIHTEPEFPPIESAALPEAVSGSEEISTETSESVSATGEHAGQEVPPRAISAGPPAPGVFEGLRYDDASYVASVAPAPGEQWPAESSGAPAPEGLPAHDEPKAGNASSEEKTPVAAGPEKPVNDHPTAA